jgi:hypothetical protein
MTPATTEQKAQHTPAIEVLLTMVRDSVSPVAREHAARMLYLQGGVDALSGKANAKFDDLRKVAL